MGAQQEEMEVGMEHTKEAVDLVDLAVADSFPASDPPFFMAAAAVVGTPRSAPLTPHRQEAPLRGRCDDSSASPSRKIR
jgi:hypothetical protein